MSSPANVMVTAAGAKLVDFGLSAVAGEPEVRPRRRMGPPSRRGHLRAQPGVAAGASATLTLSGSHDGTIVLPTKINVDGRPCDVVLLDSSPGPEQPAAADPAPPPAAAPAPAPKAPGGKPKGNPKPAAGR
jgi:hypothetical protein